MQLAAPRDIDLARLDAWRPYWRDDTLPDKAAGSPMSTDDDSAWAQHVLTTARDLLLASYIPCFDAIRLVSCRAKEVNGNPKLDVICELPALDNYLSGTFRTAFSEATACAKFMTNHAPEPENRERLWEQVNKTSKPRIIRDNMVESSILRVLQTAYVNGVPFAHLGAGVYQLGWGAQAQKVNRSTTSKDALLGLRLSMFKHVTARVLNQAGLPGPDHRLVTSVDDARAAAETFGWPVVVKPADADRGEGVSVDVGPDQIEAACLAAKEASERGKVLVERQIEGVCVRLFIADGKLLYAVRRDPMGVLGDGKRTVAELVADECASQMEKPAWARSKIRPLDDLARISIRQAGYTEASVPDKDALVPLRRIESTADGGKGDDVSDIAHPENIRIAEAAAKVCGLNNSGIDIITPDISVPWHENDAAINEVNYSPLLGGGQVSRAYLEEYLQRHLQGQGRIPVHVFVGDDTALAAARQKHAAHAKAGVAAYLATESAVYDPHMQLVPMREQPVWQRLRAPIFWPEVEALVIAQTTDALLDQELPLEDVDEVTFSGDPTPARQPDQQAERLARLKTRMQNWVRRDAS